MTTENILPIETSTDINNILLKIILEKKQKLKYEKEKSKLENENTKLEKEKSKLENENTKLEN